MKTMNMKFVAVAVVAIILLLGGGLFLYSKNKSSNPSPVASNTVSPTTTTSQSGSLLDIFSSGQNQKCDFDVKSASAADTKGTFYVSGTKVRGSLNITTNGKLDTMNILRDGDTNYIWGSALPTGIKMTLSVNDLAAKINTTSATNPNQKMDFKCVPWTVDQSLFSVPTNVKFTDTGSITISKTPVANVTQSESNPSANCSVCNSLTGNAKTACLTGLHCQ